MLLTERDAEITNLIAQIRAAKTMAMRDSLFEQIIEVWEAPITPVEQTNQPTYMTTDQARDWAWKETRRDLDDSHWTAGESGTFFGFFLHGWNNRGQYEVQRRAAVANIQQSAAIN